jgi:16S rRNA (uracil1498-N3)-methyltransferase
MSEVRRLHAPIAFAVGAQIELGPDTARHVRVLRLRTGDEVRLFDGRGLECDAVLEDITDVRVTCRISRIDARVRATARVVLVQALPKGSKLDEIVRMTTEAGVAEIQLAIAERSIARPDESRAKGRLDRLEKIAREAARQSERPDVPAITAPAPLFEVAARAPTTAARLILSPREGAPWANALETRDEAWLLIGPEGGLSEAEERALQAEGWTAATIATPILRVETAAPIAVALAVDRISSREQDPTHLRR